MPYLIDRPGSSASVFFTSMKKRILLLQGPVGGFFKYLQLRLRDADFEVKRIVFNGGDIAYALGVEFEIARLGEDGYGEFFERLYRDWRPDTIVLFGDERPIHKAAMAEAARIGIPVWCFEEGYIRPDHVTLEPGGNNANSSLFRTFDPSVTPPPTPPAPHLKGQTVAMGLRAWGYFVAYRATRMLFPHYTHHRERRLRDEFRFWIRSAYRRVMARRRDAALTAQILSGLHPPFFIVALQVHDDMQLRRHGRGWRSMPFTEMVLESFKRFAPPQARLVVKAHPLDVGHGHHRKNIRLLIRKIGLEDRVEYLQSGPLLPIVRHARGLITINSTAGIAALRNHIPVIAFGDALYHLEGLSKRPEGPADLDRFWSDPPEVDATLAWRFGEHTLASVLLPGSFYLSATWQRLTDSVIARLRGEPSSAEAGVSSEPTAAVTAPEPETATATATDPRHRAANAPMRSIRRVGIGSAGVWRRREAVATLLGAEPVRLTGIGTRSCDELAGWGFKRTSGRLRSIAAATGVPYVALEDGFLRSVRPGAGETQIGGIVDRTGIYYDARSASDLEAAVRRRAAEPPEAHDRAQAAMRAIRDLRLSKYNHAPMLGAEALGLPRGRDIVLVIDQTFGDASISGAFADSASFMRMLNAAVDENPDAVVAVKVHPESISGAKKGYLAAVARQRGIRLITVDVNPWALIEIAKRVYVVSSQFGLEAMLAGVPVTCFGAAAYAGWGLTDDRIVPIRRRGVAVTREAFAAAAYLDYCRWIDPYDGKEIDLESAVDRLAFLRDRFHENTSSVCVGFSAWKRKAVTRFVTGIGGAPRFVTSDAAAVEATHGGHGRIMVWGRRGFDPTARRDDDPPVVRVEDGFLRSVGLGAAFVTPASLVFDAEGIYYDPGRRSGFETLALETVFDERLIERARRLRETIVSRGLSKYNDAYDDGIAVPEGKVRILVPGQVEDDASVQLGSPEVRSNLELLRRVRARWPDAHVIYKPHPDVQKGYRNGRIAAADVAKLADQVVTDVSMSALLDRVDRVETMTSLTGFEALLRGRSVTCHGVPFYAGWGLTEDLADCPRRVRRLSLDELVAVTLILYPRYVDPKTRLPCPVETIVERLGAMRDDGAGGFARLGRRLRHGYAWTAHNILGPSYRFLGGLVGRR